MPARHILVADVGGTNTRVAMADAGGVDDDSIARFRNADHGGLSDILASYLAAHAGRCDGAAIAMAGPVTEGVGRLTNLDWTMAPDDLRACTGAATVTILNDLQAQGHALDHVASEALTPILPGPAPQPHQTKLVIGVGTGFNAVPVYRIGARRHVPPCEAGHATLPVLGDEDMALSRFVARHHGFPGIEDVLSGRGLSRLYDWASDGAAAATSQEVIAALERGDDPVAIRAMEAFVQALGRVAGDLALNHLPFGGVYLVGGMANAARPYLGRFGFADAFRGKGRFSAFMERFAVCGVEDDYAALTGCARAIAPDLAD